MFDISDETVAEYTEKFRRMAAEKAMFGLGGSY